MPTLWSVPAPRCCHYPRCEHSFRGNHGAPYDGWAHRFTFNIDKVTVVVPFKAHNSKYVNEPEELRDRAWRLLVENLNIQSVPNTSLEDVYQKLRISLGSIGLHMAKRDYPHPIRVVEDFAVDFLLQIKSKLKAMMLQEKINQNKDEKKEPFVVDK